MNELSMQALSPNAALYKQPASKSPLQMTPPAGFMRLVARLNARAWFDVGGGCVT